ncbi:unnamed protein product [Lymnaea stagnalis]|uniref:Uncharacterized protein n=1 Tax=Lymnaea stagnalis TaxID=6523 RepID=A0AAV2I621_LYMST
MNREFEGKAVIVTGSSAGIGEAIAFLFAQRGASVTLCGRDEERLNASLEKCLKAGGETTSDKIIMVCGDVNERQVRTSIVESTVKKFGRLDVLVANHADGSSSNFAEETEDEYDKIMNTNLKSVVFLIKEAIPHLEKSQGNIVCVSSVGSTKASPGHVSYLLSKAGMDHMVRCLALEYAPKGIRVNAVNPGLVSNTLIARHYKGNPQQLKAYLDSIAAKHPLRGRASTAEEQAEVVSFLASERASFVTGQCVKVDGGASLL